MLKTLLTAGVLLMAFTAPAFASTPIVLGSGWKGDTAKIFGIPTERSPWTFTLTKNAVFSVTDCCDAGDVYTLTDANLGVLGSTTYFAGSGVQADGSTYGLFWINENYSKIAQYLTPGSYSISITSDCGQSCPGSLGVRLDAAVVPEPASWAMLIAGFGLTGATMRRRRQAPMVAC